MRPPVLQRVFRKSGRHRRSTWVAARRQSLILNRTMPSISGRPSAIDATSRLCSSRHLHWQTLRRGRCLLKRLPAGGEPSHALLFDGDDRNVSCDYASGVLDDVLGGGGSPPRGSETAAAVRAPPQQGPVNDLTLRPLFVFVVFRSRIE